MKAAILNGYYKNGGDVTVKEIPTPEPGAGEALVKLHAAGVAQALAKGAAGKRRGKTMVKIAGGCGRREEG